MQTTSVHSANIDNNNFMNFSVIENSKTTEKENIKSNNQIGQQQFSNNRNIVLNGTSQFYQTSTIDRRQAMNKLNICENHIKAAYQTNDYKNSSISSSNLTFRSNVINNSCNINSNSNNNNINNSNNNLQQNEHILVKEKQNLSAPI
jgi:hypothetical protein